MVGGAFALLVLVALAATVAIGCGAGGSSSSQPAERHGSKKAGSTEQRAEDQTSSGERLGHPALGSADAAVVMTEFSDYQ
ncbi:MAG TPA: hypothetical protein VFY59_02755 [Rubrobacter sp.]|nr:hypothetical protein [Rubrobacter sp.]